MFKEYTMTKSIIIFLACVTVFYTTHTVYADQISQASIVASIEDIQSDATVEKLVATDKKLRAFVKSRTKYLEGDELHYWSKKTFQDVGLFIGRNSDKLGYNGALLKRAHKIDPNSAFRAFTLFSEIEPEPWGMPNIDAAWQYVNEFPNGPFINETNYIIACFYKDLFIILNNERYRSGSGEDYKLNCYEPFFTNDSFSKQAQKSKELSIQYYEKFLQYKPDDSMSLYYIRELRQGTIESWSFCAD